MGSPRPLQSAVLRLADLVPAPIEAGFGFGSLQRCLSEISSAGAGARLTAAFGLVFEAQKRFEPVAWVALRGSTFFPPDVAQGGVDLQNLAVVRVADGIAAARAAEHLARSGAFGLVVVDLNRRDGADRVATPLLTRLVGLAQKHETAIVFLTEKLAEAPSLGSLIGLRAAASRRLLGDAWEVRVSVLKDKRRGPGAVHVETCRGPAGLL